MLILVLTLLCNPGACDTWFIFCLGAEMMLFAILFALLCHLATYKH